MTKILSLDQQMEELYCLSLASQREGNEKDREKMKAMVKKAMQRELTSRQFQCLSMYYYEHMTMDEIGRNLGLSQSTVSRHIKAAKVKLQKLKAFVD